MICTPGSSTTTGWMKHCRQKVSEDEWRTRMAVPSDQSERPRRCAGKGDVEFKMAVTTSAAVTGRVGIPNSRMHAGTIRGSLADHPRLQRNDPPPSVYNRGVNSAFFRRQQSYSGTKRGRFRVGLGHIAKGSAIRRQRWIRNARSTATCLGAYYLNAFWSRCRRCKLTHGRV